MQMTASASLVAACLSLGGHVQALPVLSGLSEELAQAFPNEAPETLQDALVQALRSAANQEGLPGADLVCNRDYSVPCPAGWADVGDGENCLAPNGYEGSCAESTISFGTTPAEKSAKASECDAAFPCAGGAPEDFAAACPASWTQDADGACTAPASYDGPCVQHKSFVGLARLQKAAWGNSCGVSWPSRSTSAGASLIKRQAVGFLGLASHDGVGDGNLPTLALKMVPAQSPFPAVSEEVQHLQGAREQKEAAFEESLRAAYDQEIAHAAAAIKEAVHSSGSASFLQTKASAEGFRVKVSLSDASQPDGRVRSKIAALEAKRTALEEAAIQQACAEMSGLTSIVLSELKQNLAHRAKGVAFLQRLSPEASIRLSAGAAFPRVADLVQEMEEKRDQAESKERARILELEAALLKV